MPDDSPEAVNAYLNILRALFNLTNATHTNSSARSVTGQFFQQRMSLLATDSLTSTDGESKYTDDDNAEGVYQSGLSSRLRSLRRSLQQIAVDSGLLQAVPPSPPARAKEALDELVRPVWHDYYTDETIRNDPQFGSYYTAASMSPLEAYHFYRKIKCEAEQRLMFFEIEAIIKDPTARTAWLLLNTDFGLADMLAGLGLIPCRDRTSEQRPALEIFPAPSPPPPLDDWVRSRGPQTRYPLLPVAPLFFAHHACAPRWQVVPPSPPYHVYEVIVFSSSMMLSAGFFFVCCVCCVLFGRGYDRDRATSRMLGTGPERVDGMGWIGGAGRSKAGGSPGLFGPHPSDYPAHSKVYRTPGPTRGGTSSSASAGTTISGGGVRFTLGADAVSAAAGAPGRRRRGGLGGGGGAAEFSPLGR